MRWLAVAACRTLHKWAGLWERGKFVRIVHFALLTEPGEIEHEYTCKRCSLTWLVLEIM